MAVVVAEELVDGVDVNLGKEVATFFGEKVGTVLDVVHEEVLGEDGQADKRAIRVDLCQFALFILFTRCIPQKKCGIFDCIPQKKCGKMEWQ